MRIGKIESNPKYRMDKQFQYLPTFGFRTKNLLFF